MGGTTSNPVASGKLSSSAQSTQTPVGTNPADVSAGYISSSPATGKLSSSAQTQPTQNPALPAFNYFQNAHVTGPTDPRQITNFTNPINRAPLVRMPTAAEIALQTGYGGGASYGGYGGFSGFEGFTPFTMGYAGGGKVDGDQHEKLIRLAREILLQRGE